MRSLIVLLLLASLMSTGCLRSYLRHQEEDNSPSPYDNKTELQLLEERLGI
jgi:hypothetical protein